MKELNFLNRLCMTLQGPLADYFSYVSVAPSNLMISVLKSLSFDPQSKGNNIQRNWYINIMQSVPRMSNRVQSQSYGTPPALLVSDIFKYDSG